MTFEEKIISLSKEPLSKLYTAAKLAYETPDTGIKIEKKSAYYVIRDCAMLAKNYLPFFLISNIDLQELKGKILKEEIQDFIERAYGKEKIAKQLLEIILYRTKIVEEDKKEEVLQIDKNISNNDLENIYGEYSNLIKPIKEEKVSKNTKTLIIERLTQYFC